MLYERRFGPFFVEPIVAGLDPVTFKPYICNMVHIKTSLDASRSDTFRLSSAYPNAITSGRT